MKYSYKLKILTMLFIISIALPLRAQNLLEHEQAPNVTNTERSANSNDPKFKYKLRPQDLLVITVFQEPELDKEVRVESDGTIVLPLIGKVKVGDLSISEAQLVIQTMYNKDYLVNPQVSLLVKEYSPQRVQVLGQVNAPGFVKILPEEKMTLTKAIAGASGFNLRAERKAVKIRRKFSEGDTQVIEVNVKEIQSNPNASDIEVLDGDVITVEESVF